MNMRHCTHLILFLRAMNTVEKMNPSFTVFCDKNQIPDNTCIHKKKGRRRKRKHIPHAKRSAEFVENRNRRERERVRGLKTAFETLRLHVPYCDEDNTLSKVDILLAATDYIQGMIDMLQEHDHNEPCKLKNNQKQIPNCQVPGDVQWTNQRHENHEWLPSTYTACGEIHLKSSLTSGFQWNTSFYEGTICNAESGYQNASHLQYGNQCNLFDENNYQATNCTDIFHFNHNMEDTKRAVRQNGTHYFPAICSDNCSFYNQSYPSLSNTEYCQQIEYNIL